MKAPDFNGAELAIKEALIIPIDIGIKEINDQLRVYRRLPGMILMVTGGQAIEKYFPHSPTLRTHDYDLKLISPKNVPINRDVRKIMLTFGDLITENIEIRINKYVVPILTSLRTRLIKDHNVDLVLYPSGKVFKKDRVSQSLSVIQFKLRGGGRIRTNSIADIFVVDPSDIYHYKTFTGMKGSNPILSKDAGRYYIPYKKINGVPYAGMGYVLWDTLRMIDYTKKLGLPKYSRYVSKKDAIINALNNPEAKISCDAMKDYVGKCNADYSSDCVIGGKTYRTVNSLLRYALEEDILPRDPRIIRRIRDNFDKNYLCEIIKRVVRK